VISPSHAHVENTMNTLLYADGVKELRAGDNGGILLNENDEIKMDGISKGTINYTHMNK